MSPEGWVLIIGALTTSIISILGVLQNKKNVSVLQDSHAENVKKIESLEKKVI